MQDTDALCDQEVLALTLIGEFESLGDRGMKEGACVVLNRVKSGKTWWGTTIRSVCLHPGQFDCWWPQTGNADRDRIIQIAFENPLYGPYQNALKIAGDAIAGLIPDCTNNAVSYFVKGQADPEWAKGKLPCFVHAPVLFFDLAAVA